MGEIVLWLVFVLFRLLSKKMVMIFLLSGLFGVVLIVMGLRTIDHVNTFIVPDEYVTEPVWIPENAEIRSVYEVRPGTFKINISFEEMQKTTAGQRVLLVYSVSRYPSIEYYRAAPDGIFHYTKKRVEPPPERVIFGASWEVTFDKEHGAFQYTLVRNRGQGYVMGGIVLLIGAGLLFYITFWIFFPALFRLLGRWMMQGSVERTKPSKLP